jgi:serine/threonine-protein kinase
MIDNARVREMVERLLDSGSTPEELCADCPELLPDVREQWERCRRLEAAMDDLFPSAGSFANWESGDARGGTPALPRIPGYEVEAVLGRGGMGIVYRARHLPLNRTVALKMLLSGAYASPVEQARFLREAQSIAGLGHANVVQVHDVGQFEGRPFYTMELVEGTTLAQSLAGVPQPASRAAAMGVTLAQAIESAHRSGIIHRDLKPANILLTVDGTAKVSDFGLAHHFQQEHALTLTGERVGTPSYMAPEQVFARAGTIGPATDIYALGAILYEMLTGRPPFRGESSAETERQLLAEDPVPPSRLNARVPRDLETICLKCLQKEPRRRYPTAAALAQDLRRFQKGEPISARQTSLAERAVKWVRRRPAVATALTAAALVSVGLIGGSLWIISQRAATTRLVNDDLQSVTRFERSFAWAEARTSLERARARLGAGGPTALRDRIAQIDRDLLLAARLDAIRLERATNSALVVDLIQSYYEYCAAFGAAGLGAVGDDPVVVAQRIRALDIQPVLVGALDDWATCVGDRNVQKWLMDVAKHADGDPTDWRARARDPDLWSNKTALAELAKVLNDDTALGQLGAGGSDATTPLLVALGGRMKTTLGSEVAIPFLQRVQRAHPTDFWVNHTLAQALVDEKRYAQAARYYQSAVSIRPEAAITHAELGEVLAVDYRIDEAIDQFRQAAQLNPSFFRPPFDIGTALGSVDRNEDAVAAFSDAVRVAPDEATLKRLPGVGHDIAVVHENFALTLQKLGRDAQAIDHYRQAMALDPRNKYPAQRLRDLCLAQGRREEALIAWRKALEADPDAAHADWHGYAELSLFLGHEDEYGRARQALLDRFAGNPSPNIAERTGRTCLLAPGTDEQLNRATDLIDRAVKSTSAGHAGARPYFLFAKGLSEYRYGRMESAMSYMLGDAGRVLGPAPLIVLSMAQQRLGHQAEARFTLASGINSYDWAPERADGAESWMYHILRREAERLVLPDLPAFLAGKYQPSDNQERIAMTGACQFMKLYVARARLWSDALASEPRWVAPGRRRAAGAAALAGTGGGTDAGALTDAERAQWRAKAREWVQEELAGADAAQGDAARQQLLATLTYWSASPELSGVRDKNALELLPAGERDEWARLWDRVAAVMTRLRAPQ